MSNKGLSVATVIEKAKLASDVPFIALLEIQIMNAATQTFAETIYLANNSENVIFQSNTYIPYHFDIQLRHEAGAQPEVSLTARDLAGTVASKLDQYAGGAGSVVKLRIVNTANLAQGVEAEETFEVLESSCNNYLVTLKLGVESTLRKIFPRRSQLRDRCAWKYKSAECGYVGAMATCDLTQQGPNGCDAHNNTANFGGFPGLVSRGIGF